jgi:hypothetical protein
MVSNSYPTLKKKFASYGSELNYCNPDIVLGVLLHTYLHINKMFGLKITETKPKKEVFCYSSPRENGQLGVPFALKERQEL